MSTETPDPTPQPEPTCTCDPVEQGGMVHHAWCELNHPHHPCDERTCRFAVPQVREDGAYREQDVTATIEQELQLAHDGDGYEPRAVAEEIVLRFVSPLLAERDEIRRQLAAEHERAEGWHNSYQAMRAAMNDVRAERDRLRLAWLSAARGRMRARMDRDILGEQIEPYGECDPACDCGDHQGRSCGCHVTGEEARAWLRKRDIELDQLRADLKARTEERDRARALLDEDSGTPGARSVVAVMPAGWRGQFWDVFDGTETKGAADTGIAKLVRSWCVVTPDAEPRPAGRTVVFPEDWRAQLEANWLISVQLIESWIEGTECAELPVAAPVEAETHATTEDRTVTTLHVTTMREVPDERTDQWVRHEFEGDTWEGWLIGYGLVDGVEEAYVERDDGQPWVVLRENITEIATPPVVSDTQPAPDTLSVGNAAPPTLAQTRTGTDWCPKCGEEVGTNRYLDEDNNTTQRCATCGTVLVPLPVVGVDYFRGCTNPECRCHLPGRPCEEHQRHDSDEFCPRCGWHERHHPGWPHRNGCTDCPIPDYSYPTCWTDEQVSQDQAADRPRYNYPAPAAQPEPQDEARAWRDRFGGLWTELPEGWLRNAQSAVVSRRTVKELYGPLTQVADSADTHPASSSGTGTEADGE